MRQLIFAAAAFALAGCSDPPGPPMAHGKPIEHWLRALRDPDANIRKRAADVLGNVGPADPTIVPELASALKDPSRTVREAAVVALLKMGPAAKDAAPALVEASRDSDAKVRSHAAKALQNLRNAP
jgi:HEAT repeat protein